VKGLDASGMTAKLKVVWWSLMERLAVRGGLYGLWMLKVLDNYIWLETCSSISLEDFEKVRSKERVMHQYVVSQLGLESMIWAMLLRHSPPI
jgi:hypothetical protein